MNYDILFIAVLIIMIISCRERDKSYLSADRMYIIYKIDGVMDQGIAEIEPDEAKDEFDCGIAIFRIEGCNGDQIMFDFDFPCCVWIPNMWEKCETLSGREIEVYLTLPVEKSN